MSDEPATECDECYSPIEFRITCYAVGTGKTDEGMPVIRILCAACYGKQRLERNYST